MKHVRDKPTRWQKWRTHRQRLWMGRGMDPDLAKRWALAEQTIRMRVAILFGDEVAERLEMVVTPSGDLDLNLDQLI